MLRRSSLPPNVLGSLYMTLGALAYVVNDGLVRIAAEEGVDVYQALFLRGCAMIVVFAVASQIRSERLDRQMLTKPLVGRVAAEVVGTALFFAALLNLEFANAQTILMLTPFGVTLVGAVALGEKVTTRRWVTIAVGFAGVLAVVRPTPSGFSPWALVVLGSAVALMARELATRQVPPTTPALPIALLTALAITAMTGSVSATTGWGAVTARAALMLALACVCLVAGYLFLIETVRVSDLSVTAPFRYTAVIGAVIVGLVFFDEIPDALTLLGCTAIVTAGVAAAREDARRTAVS
ncbi:MAG: DMT family transporter [Acidimicrobiales bacterium]